MNNFPDIPNANNWTDINDIFSWFPLSINSFTQTYGYEYSGANYTKYK